MEIENGFGGVEDETQGWEGTEREENKANVGRNLRLEENIESHQRGFDSWMRYCLHKGSRA